MAKKVSYNEKSPEELRADLAKLQMELREQQAKMLQGRGVKEYRVARKNIARVLTALSRSTNMQK